MNSPVKAPRKLSRVKNPRKLKKAWKTWLIKYVESQNVWPGKWKLHWVPMRGWDIKASAQKSESK